MVDNHAELTVHQNVMNNDLSVNKNSAYRFKRRQKRSSSGCNVQG